MADEAAEQAIPQPEKQVAEAQPLPPLGISGVVVAINVPPRNVLPNFNVKDLFR